MGCNPKTREPAPVAGCRVVTFRPSRVPRGRVDARRSGAGEDAWAAAGSSAGMPHRAVPRGFKFP